MKLTEPEVSVSISFINFLTSLSLAFIPILLITFPNSLTEIDPKIQNSFYISIYSEYIFFIPDLSESNKSKASFNS